MKKNLINILTIILFVILLLWMVDFRVLDIFDMKIMLVMLLSIGLLTVTSYKKSNTDFKSLFAYQTILTSIFATSLLYLQELSKTSDLDFFIPLQPILYGIMYYIIVSIYLSLRDNFESDPTDNLSILENNYGLTAREVAIAKELLKGKSNKEIASSLFIAESTVKKHVQNTFRKMEVSNRQEFKDLLNK